MTSSARTKVPRKKSKKAKAKSAILGRFDQIPQRRGEPIPKDRETLIAYIYQFDGNIAQIARSMGHMRITISTWIKELGLADDLKEARAVLMDDTERSLQRNAIQSNNVIAQIFIAKTQGKDRGYVEIDRSAADLAPARVDIPAYLTGPQFLDVYRDIRSQNNDEYVFYGGRGSLKSSFVSLAFIERLVNNPKMHGLVLRKIKETLRDSVYSQLTWAITELGLEDKFKTTLSPMEMEYLPTGQKIFFRGADEPAKIKSIKPPFGYIGLLWFEELDQFAGENEIRNIEQSAIRGGDIAYIFKSFNPPRSAANWANKYVKIKRDRQYLHFSNFTDSPREWLGKVFLDRAELLRKINPDAFDHEYGGLANGTGGLVFQNVKIRRITLAEIAQFERQYHGLDWGYFPDPFNYGKMSYDPARLTLYIYGERRMYKASNKQTFEALYGKRDPSGKLVVDATGREIEVGLGLTPADDLIADSAEPKSIADYKSWGASIRGTEKFPDSLDYSMKWLQSLAEIVIDDEKAPFHAQEFLEYEHDTDKDGNFISGYPDKNNHAIDDTRYAMTRIWRVRGQ